MVGGMRGVAVVIALGAWAVPAATRGPSTAEVLKRAGAHIDAFQKQLAGIVAEENYVQSVHRASFAAGMELDAVRSRVAERRLRSDLLLVRPVGADRYVEFRDVFEVDGRSVRDRAERLSQLFLNPPQGAASQLDRVVEESARYNLGNVVRTMNTPLLALMFLHPRYQPHLEFELEAANRTESRIGFRETRRPTLIRTPRGRDLPAHGRFWLDPASAAVMKSELMVQDTQVTARVTVTYRREESLGFAVPVAMEETYTSARERIAGKAGYGRFRQFQVNVDEHIKPVKP